MATKAARSRGALKPKPAPKPSREDSRHIVEAIVGAVMDLADPEATMETIASRAGVGVASIYRYFPNRGAIYAEISRRLHRRFLAQLREELAVPSRDLATMVVAVCRVVVQGPAVSRELRRSLNGAVPMSWSQESASEVYGVAMAEIAVWLQGNLPEPPADLEQRVFVAFSGVRGAIMMAMLFPERAPPDEKLIALMAGGVLGVLASRTPL
jgi:AcrR family transcriptional regulator